MAVVKGPNKGNPERSSNLRSRKQSGAPTAKGEAEANSDVRWITETNDKLASKSMCDLIRTLATNQGYRLWDNTRYMSLYANTDFMFGYNNGSAGPVATDPMPRMSFNKIKINTDTLVGKLIESNSRIVMTTSEGDFAEWQKARKIEWALEGEWHRMRIYQEASRVALDGITVGTGWLKLYKHDGKVCCERVFPNEVFVDEIEAAYGAPKKLYQMRYVKKDTLIRLYPDKADVIRAAKTVNPPRFAWTLYTPGMIEVCEGWALPIGGRPGRHMIALSSGSLLDEVWDEEHFPLIPFRAGDMPFGWYGQGFTEQVMGAQMDLNKIWNIMQKAAHLGLAPFWVVDEGASINIKHLNNDVGHIVETSSTDPKWFTNPPFHADGYKYIESLERVIDNFYGNSQMESSGETQLNRLDSRKALVEFQDMGATRHAVLIERWQEWFVKVAERTIMLAKQIAKEEGKYPVLVKKSQSKARQLDWKDLDLDSDPYMMQCAPSNMLSRTVAGRKDDINDMITSGLLSQGQGAQLLKGPPDVDAAISEISAPEDYTDWVIEQFVDEGEYTPPNQIDDIARMTKRISEARYQYILRGAPEKTIALFEQWLEDAKAIVDAQIAQQQQQAAAAAAAQAPAGAPSGPTASPKPPAPNPPAGLSASPGAQSAA